MAKGPFLDDVAKLHHRDRTRRAVELGRAAHDGDLSAQATIADLVASPSPYERLLGLHTAFATRDGAVVAGALSDPSRTVRRKAAKMLALTRDPDVARGLGAIVGTRALRRTIAHLVRKGRLGPVDTFLHDATQAGAEPAGRYQKLLIIFMCAASLLVTFMYMTGPFTFMNPIFICNGE